MPVHPHSTESILLQITQDSDCSRSLKIQTAPDHSRFRLFQITQDSDCSRSLKIQSILDHSLFHSRSFMIKSISFMIQSFPVHSKHDLVSLSSQIQSISYSCLALTMCSKILSLVTHEYTYW